MPSFGRIVLVWAVALVAAGCGQTPATLAGGKPVSHWVAALKDSSAKVRKTAVLKLRNVGPADPAALPALIGALKDRDAEVRREAILALANYGPGAREAVPLLTDLKQKDANARVRSDAAQALEKLQSGE
jgi:HEAT repeat protein